jgi:hypothetical protein
MKATIAGIEMFHKTLDEGQSGDQSAPQKLPLRCSDKGPCCKLVSLVLTAKSKGPLAAKKWRRFRFFLAFCLLFCRKRSAKILIILLRSAKCILFCTKVRCHVEGCQKK